MFPLTKEEVRDWVEQIIPQNDKRDNDGDHRTFILNNVSITRSMQIHETGGEKEKDKKSKSTERNRGSIWWNEYQKETVQTRQMVSIATTSLVSEREDERQTDRHLKEAPFTFLVQLHHKAHTSKVKCVLALIETSAQFLGFNVIICAFWFGQACAVHQFQGHEQFKTPAGFFRCLVLCVAVCVCCV